MVNYSMDMLTVIPVNEISTKGFAFVNDNLKDVIFRDNDSEKLQKFWNYFEKYWMSSNKMIETWNISSYQGNINVLTLSSPRVVKSAVLALFTKWCRKKCQNGTFYDFTSKNN